jgi:hypothetical protein
MRLIPPKSRHLISHCLYHLPVVDEDMGVVAAEVETEVGSGEAGGVIRANGLGTGS